MLASLLCLFRLVWLFWCGHQALVLKNLALRQQLSIYKRKQKRPRLTRWDHLFWIALAGYGKGWRKYLLVVHPDTVDSWIKSTRRKPKKMVCQILEGAEGPLDGAHGFTVLAGFCRSPPQPPGGRPRSGMTDRGNSYRVLSRIRVDQLESHNAI
jgi:hypothetical protein